MCLSLLISGAFGGCELNLFDYAEEVSIYAASGIGSVDLTCINGTNNYDSYNVSGVCDDITIYCGIWFADSCEMNLISNGSGSSDWECIGNCSWRESVAPTNAPSMQPTITPSIAPSTSPSQAPSGAPTTNPSQSPSSAPSISPSAAPSQTPSQTPSQPPTESPTLQPTRNPTNYANYSVRVDVPFRLYNFSDASSRSEEFFSDFEELYYNGLKDIFESEYVEESSLIHYYSFDMIFSRVYGFGYNRSIDWQSFYPNIDFFDDDLDDGDDSDTARLASNSLSRRRRRLLQTGGGGGNDANVYIESIDDYANEDVISLSVVIYCADEDTEGTLSSLSKTFVFVKTAQKYIRRLINDSNTRLYIDTRYWIETDLR